MIIQSIAITLYIKIPKIFLLFRCPNLFVYLGRINNIGFYTSIGQKNTLRQRNYALELAVIQQILTSFRKILAEQEAFRNNKCHTSIFGNTIDCLHTMLHTDAIAICAWKIIKISVFRFLRIRHICEDNVKSSVVQNTVLIRIGFSSINRICQTIKHLNIAMPVTGQDHIHFSNTGCIGDLVSVHRGLPQGFHVGLGSGHIVMDISETLNKETAGAAEWVINFLANLRIYQANHCFDDVTRRKVFAQIILRGGRCFQEIFKSIPLNIAVHIGKHKRIKLIHDLF